MIHPPLPPPPPTCVLKAYMTCTLDWPDCYPLPPPPTSVLKAYKTCTLDWPVGEPCIHADGTLIAATLLTKESAISSVSGAVSGSSLERPMIMVLISVSSWRGTSLTILSNKLMEKQCKFLFRIILELRLKTELRNRTYVGQNVLH